MHRGVGTAAALVALMMLPACAGATAEDQAIDRPLAVRAAPTTTATAGASATTAAPPPPTVAVTVPPATAPPPPPPPTTTTRPFIPRIVHEQAWSPFAAAEGVVLLHPSSRVERVGFHQSNHDGARELVPLGSAAAPVTLEDRERDTGSRTAADVVVEPASEIRAPVTGRVKRAGTYVLYCDYSDDFAVIEPDARPGWEVKVLHIDGVRVRAGDRVVAGETVIAPRATVLPFESQVEEVSATPPWPHVHIEVVDPSIPDRPSGRGC